MNKKYKKVVLDNGVRLYVHGDKTMRKYLVSYAVNYGSSGIYSRFTYDGKEYEVLPGCAHFLEHMLLEQSKYGNLYAYFRELKHKSNAYTGDIITKFYFSGVSNIKTSIKKLIDSLENPIFKEKEVEETSHAVAEETKRGLDDPFYCGLHLQYRNLYKDINYCHESLSSIGTEETTNALDYNMLRLCYDAFYNDDNKIITITGPLDEDDMINYIKKIYSKIPRHENKTKLYIPGNITCIRKKEDILVRNSVEDDYLYIGYNNTLKDFSWFEKNNYISYINQFKFSTNTEFYERLKKENIMVTNYGCGCDNVFDDGNFSYCFRFIVKDKDKFLKEYDKELKNNCFDEKDFELFKKSLLSTHIYSLEDKYFDYDYLPDQIFRFNEETDYVDRVRGLSFERFIKFYNSLDFTNRSIVLLTKEGKDGKR